MEGVDNIVRLLQEHLLNLVNAVLKDFHLHSLVLNVDAVRLHEGDAEPLGSEALFLYKDTRSKFV